MMFILPMNYTTAHQENCKVPFAVKLDNALDRMRSKNYVIQKIKIDIRKSK